MRLTKTLLLILFINLIILDPGHMEPGQQQRSYSKQEIEKMRKKNLKKYPLPENAIELELKYSFPSEELLDRYVYLYGARFISKDPSENIYISNSRAHNLFKFDSSGKFLARFGRKGQGPGELDGPFRIMVTEDYIIVHENGNRRVQFLDKKGRYVKSFKTFKTYLDMSMNNDGLIFATPILMSEKSYLIDVLTQDGKLLYSFGKPKALDCTEVKLAFNNKRELLVAFEHFPIVRKYSEKGELLAEYKIDYKIMNYKEKINLKRINSLSKGRNRGYAVIIDAIRPSEEGFYVLHQALRTEILEFDKDGDLINTYWHDDVESYTSDFLIQNKGDEKIFHVLKVSPENRIDVFALKNQ